ncbi:ATP-binding protein [Dethiosulfatarculus sandiegensis]|uniref:ATP-binding protein n=1 Tax=Dethiosulfatarculus sandiegensis TaxID=1429043 RepID=UPI0005CB7F93|nr:ATP-binding protein [Dethiosulfatarculus sandiegensis]
MNQSFHQKQVNLECEGDIVEVRKAVRIAAQEIGFGVTDTTRIVTAASELARNVHRFAGTGLMTLESTRNTEHKGITLIFTDNGPGIADVDQAMELGFTTGGGLGLGLPGAKRLMDEMKLESKPGQGTRICISKWLS